MNIIDSLFHLLRQSPTFSVSHRVKKAPRRIRTHATLDKGYVMRGFDTQDCKQLHIVSRNRTVILHGIFRRNVDAIPFMVQSILMFVNLYNRL